MRADEAHRKLQAHCARGDFQAALPLARALVDALPQEPALWFLLGCVQTELQNLKAATDAFTQTAALNPNDPAAHYNLGCVAQTRGDFHTAIAAFTRAIDLEPDRLEAHNNLGNALRQAGRLPDAIRSFKAALRIAPTARDPALNLADALRDQGVLAEAQATVTETLGHHPKDPTATLLNLRLQAETCNFERAATFAPIRETVGITTGASAPFFLLHCEDHPERQRKRSEVWSRHNVTRRSKPKFATQPRKKLRVGYFSVNFHDHPWLFLSSDHLRNHDTSAFEIFGYSMGPPKASEARDRIIPILHSYQDLHRLADDAIAERARQDAIDIAIDVDGHTRGARLSVFGHGAAPIQLSFLGYPGTLATDCIDYIVGDPTVIPPEQRQHYAERILFMPNSYAPTENTRRANAPPTTRADHDLPQDAIVLSCFNNPIKLGLTEFDIWMHVMRRVPNTVLWLLDANPLMRKNLRAHAALRGVSEDRLVFAPKLSYPEHLERYGHADLVVDTFVYNAHTTASDALWAGVPVLTRCGEQFASRVATSFVKAAGLPDLSVDSADAYKAKLLDFCNSPSKIAIVKERLRANRPNAPLFDTESYTRQFEEGLKQMHATWSRQDAPQDIVLAPT